MPARSAVTPATVPLLEHIAAHRVLYAALDLEGAGAMERIAAVYRCSVRAARPRETAPRVA
ncbi:hypothetical protein [Streptomyces sp. CA-132043]|uniref:hypothetical protein n=1 Tax=Streptomyces sp. CA-132043 TaxID=3240048 RepID=UPI003D8FA36D